MNPWRVEDPKARKFVAYKFVPVAEVEKSFWKVDEPLARKFVA